MIFISQIERFEKLKQGTRFFDVPEVDTESLHFHEQIFDVDRFITYQRLNENAHKPHEATLQILVLRLVACFNARGYVEVEKLARQVHRRRQPIDHFHRVQAHVHVHQRLKVIRHLTRGNELQQAADADGRVVVH